MRGCPSGVYIVHSFEGGESPAEGISFDGRHIYVFLHSGTPGSCLFLFLFPFDELFGELHVVEGTFGVGVVHEYGYSVAGSFAQPDIALYDRVENQLAEVLFQLFVDLVSQS